ncbi:unnamed protein product [Somion occarium]|uniref:F-box domain-containing protein n=1 Tax=Somion occarium TaxID=3059160 RepID=A0ABP1DD24_9APHY
MGFAALPYELRLQVTTLANVVDAVNLLCTSRFLYTQMADESMWKVFCSRYGATDLSVFRPNITFYQLYAGLLHTYGPLIGLWANDHPFKGNIMEFRYFRHGIIGEVWRFPTIPLDNLMTNEKKYAPELPSYHKFLNIELVTGVRYNVKQFQDTRIIALPQIRPARLSWHVDQGYADYVEDHQPTFHRLSATRQSIWLHRALTKPTLHPEFPGSGNDAWYDSERDLPHLLEEPSLAFDNTSILVPLNIPRDYLMGAPGTIVKPPALSIYPFPTSGEISNLHTPHFYGIDDFRDVTYWDPDIEQHNHDRQRVYPRYYPLRIHKHHLAISMDDPQWHPKCLEGLWLCASGTYGTEVIYLEYNELREEISACKITGNIQVPRGATAWKFDINSEALLDISDIEVFGKFLRFSKVYCGEAVVSDRGFRPHTTSFKRLVVVIDSYDEIRLRIGATIHISRCIRYRGRD